MKKYIQKNMIKYILLAILFIAGGQTVCLTDSSDNQLPYIVEQIEKHDQNGKEAVADEKDETWITVFVHGMISIRPYLTINNFIHFMTDTVEDTHYAISVDCIRQDPFFHQNQPMLGLGL